MYKMHPNKVYFWQQVGKYVGIAAIIAGILFAIIGVAALFDARSAHKKVNIKYSVGMLGSDNKADGVFLESHDKNTLVSDFIHATDFYVMHGGVDKRCSYEIWFYDTDKNFISMASFDSEVQPPIYEGAQMPCRVNAEGAYYVDENGQLMSAEYIRIVLKPMAADKFDSVATNWLKILSYKDVVQVYATQTSFVNEYQEEVDEGSRPTVPAYPEKGNTVTEPTQGAN